MINVTCINEMKDVAKLISWLEKCLGMRVIDLVLFGQVPHSVLLLGSNFSNRFNSNHT